MGALITRLRKARRHEPGEPFTAPSPHRDRGNAVTASRRFTALPEQVGQARQFVRAIVGEQHVRRYDIELVTSELAGNAVRHGGQGADREFEVTVTTDEEAVVVSVRDSGLTGTPQAGTCDLDSDGGRGLALVEMVARRWGFHRDSTGTVVWAEVDPAPLLP
jgi:anti-sigma regulatory factor (Ser/Thr protein kinase)